MNMKALGFCHMLFNKMQDLDRQSYQFTNVNFLFNNVSFVTRPN